MIRIPVLVIGYLSYAQGFGEQAVISLPDEALA
jgi:hypothetical protein